jgi:hypothetical protein
LGVWGSQNRAEKNYDYQNQPRGICLQWGVRRNVAKVGHKKGNFGNAGADRISIQGTQMKIVSQRRERAKWV